jgi:hypothetical protein
VKKNNQRREMKSEEEEIMSGWRVASVVLPLRWRRKMAK